MPLFNPPRLKVEGSGTLTASGSEQTIKEITRVGRVQGYIDFTNMANGDITVISTYVKIKSGGSYILQGQKTLVGAQTPKLLYIFEFPTTNYGFKISLQQTDGTNRDYDWIIFMEN
jgi:hypothetical protein